MQGIAVRAHALERVMAVALRRHGASAFAASEVAKALRRAEQIGNPHCGLGHLALDCAQLHSGRVAGRAVPQLHQERPGVVQVEAGEGFAQPAFALGLPAALSAAATLGVAVLAVRRAYTPAALGWFPEQVARSGFIGIAFTNASASVTAPGGFRPVLGTNPIALAVPDGHGGIAFQFDQCTSAANLRHVREAAQRGEPLPPGWAVARDGRPTTDAREALAGALLPAGGSRGYGLALMAEVLASAFTGSAMSLDTPSLAAPEGPPHSLGLFCLVLDPSAIAGAQFHHTLGRLQDAIESQPGARLPGTRARAGECLTVDGALWRQALSLARLAPAPEA